MKKTVCVFLVLLVCAGALFASTAVNARIIDSSSSLYDYVDALYALNGLAKPSTNRPWSEAEARLILGRLDKSSFDDVCKKLYEQAESIVNEGAGTIAAKLDANLEGYAHTNSSDFILEEDWVRSYARRKPLVSIGLEFSVGDNFWSCSDLDYQFSRASSKDEYAMYAGSDRITADGYVASYLLDPSAHYVKKSFFFGSPVMSNAFFDFADFEFIWPKRAVLSVGGDNWNFSIDRDRLKIGDAHLGNLLVDDASDFNEFMRLSFFSNEFNYDWILMFVNTLTTRHEQVMEDEARIFMIHTLDFRIGDVVDFKVSENVIYRYKVFDLMYLNPAFIYHNLNNRAMFNAIAFAEIDVALSKGLNLYGQYAMDQARAPLEGDEQADASGLVIGLEYTSPSMGGVLTSYAEYTMTTPLLYRRDGVDFVKATRYYGLGCANEDDPQSGDYYGHIPFFEFIGLQFGGDTRAVKAGAKWMLPGKAQVEAYGLLLDHGQATLYKSHNVDGFNADDANIKGKTPTGDVFTRALVLSLAGDIDFGFLNGLSAFAEADWVGRWDVTKATGTWSNFKNDFQLSLGVSYSLGVGTSK